jgi:hypothetical protein
MKDLKIKEGAILFKNGDWVLVDKANRIIQNAIVALRTVKNDWLLDYRKGINYFDRLKAGQFDLLQSEIKLAVREVKGVDSITKFSFSKTNEKITINITVMVSGDEYNITEGLNI